MIDYRSLSQEAKTGLRGIILFLNTPSGTGRFRQTTNGNFKVRLSDRESLIRSLELLLTSSLPDVSPIIERAIDIICSYEEIITKQAKPMIQNALMEAARERPPKIFGLGDPCFVNRVSALIIIPERITLDYIKLMEIELTTVLKLFGLHRYSKI